MRARLHQNCKHGLYWGQVYDEKKKKWKTVTMSCITKMGARIALKKWAREHGREEEFEI